LEFPPLLIRGAPPTVTTNKTEGRGRGAGVGKASPAPGEFHQREDRRGAVRAESEKKRENRGGEKKTEKGISPLTTVRFLQKQKGFYLGEERSTCKAHKRGLEWLDISSKGGSLHMTIMGMGKRKKGEVEDFARKGCGGGRTRGASLGSLGKGEASEWEVS